MSDFAARVRRLVAMVPGASSVQEGGVPFAAFALARAITLSISVRSPS